MCRGPQTPRAGTYANTYGRYIYRHRDVYTYIGWGSVQETAVGFRYDTVDRTARIFGIGALSPGKISAHHRMPEKYFDTVYWCLRALMHVCTGAYEEHSERYPIVDRTERKKFHAK